MSIEKYSSLKEKLKRVRKETLKHFIYIAALYLIPYVILMIVPGEYHNYTVVDGPILILKLCVYIYFVFFLVKLIHAIYLYTKLTLIKIKTGGV